MTNISRWECKHSLARVKWLHIHNYWTFPGIESERQKGKQREGTTSCSAALFSREQTHRGWHSLQLHSSSSTAGGGPSSTACLLSVTICSRHAYWADQPPVNHCPVAARLNQWGRPTAVSHPHPHWHTLWEELLKAVYILLSREKTDANFLVIVWN